MDINIFDPQYVQKQQVANLQRMAAEQNSMRVQRYKQASSDWVANNIHNRELGLPVTDLPIIPRKIVVTDDGEWKEVAFNDLQPPVLPAPVMAQSSPLRAAIPAVDRLDQVLAALQYMNSKLDTLLSR
jgi:hypothetical protein